MGVFAFADSTNVLKAGFCASIFESEVAYSPTENPNSTATPKKDYSPRRTIVPRSNVTNYRNFIYRLPPLTIYEILPFKDLIAVATPHSTENSVSIDFTRMQTNAYSDDITLRGNFIDWKFSDDKDLSNNALVLTDIGIYRISSSKGEKKFVDISTLPDVPPLHEATAFSATKDLTIALISFPGAIYEVDMRTGQLTNTIGMNIQRVHFGYPGGNSFLVFGHDDEGTVVEAININKSNKKQILDTIGIEENILAAGQSPDRQWLTYITTEGVIHCLNLETGKEMTAKYQRNLNDPLFHIRSIKVGLGMNKTTDLQVEVESVIGDVFIFRI